MNRDGRQMYRSAALLLMVSAIFFATGCSNRMWEDAKKGTTDTFNYVFDTAPTARPYHETESIPIIELNYRAADVLFSNVSKGELTMESAIFVRRFTNQEDPSDMALFGDVVTQQISDRLVQRGVLIKDGKPNTTDYEYAEGFSASDYQSRSSLSAKQLPLARPC